MKKHTKGKEEKGDGGKATADGAVERFVSPPLDTRADRPVSTLLVVRNNKQLPDQVVQDSGVAGVIDTLFRIHFANRDLWSSEAHHLGPRSKTPNFVPVGIEAWDKQVEQERAAVWKALQGMDQASALAAQKLAPRIDDFAAEVARKIEQTDPTAWIGVPATSLPENLRGALRRAANRGTIRHALDTTAPRRTFVYCVADIGRWSQHREVLKILQRARDGWAYQKVHAAERPEHPLALPGLLTGLARRLRLLRPELLT